MRVALNAGILRAPRTGIGQYVVELSAALALQNDVELHFFDGLRWCDKLPATSLPGYTPVSGLVKHLLPNAYSLRRIWQQQRFTHGVRQRRPELYHEPSLWPLAFDGPMVMTLHDLTHLHYPHTQPADRLREIERRLPAALQRAERVLVDSQFIAGEVQQHYGIATDKLVVAPLGSAAQFYPRSDEELAPTLRALDIKARQYLLCVGTLEPRKNLQQALDSYLALPETVRRHYPLLIAGMPGWHSDQLQPSLDRAQRDGQVRLLGYQDDATLAALLAGARLLLFPSLYEGFGLPVLEAMASGTPVLVSRRAALPEVAGEAGSYFEPDDQVGCTKSLQRLIDDDAEWLTRRTAGLQQAAQFSWAECARITAASYRDVLER